MVTDAQTRVLWRCLADGLSLRNAAMKANMNRKTAAHYRDNPVLPSERNTVRQHRTRSNPFEHVWESVEERLKAEPKLQSKTLFEWLQREHPGKFPDGQLRTFQRHVKQWRATDGPAKEVFFPQQHHPGRLASSDFTHMTQLRITINRQPFDHMLYHFTLTWSNWETAVICYSESFESLSHGLQTALAELGGVPQRHRTDRLSAAVQNLSDEKEFTRRYQSLLEHYSITGEKTNPNSPHENGDVEQSHHRLQQAIEQALLLRESRDFTTVQEYESFLRETFAAKNANRRERIEQERATLGPLPTSRIEHRKQVDVRVNKFSLIRVDNNGYSVPSRLIGEKVRVMVDADWLEVYYAQKHIERIPRSRGRGKNTVNYRHIIDWLVRKPGAFANYKYQAELFPTTRFRIAYDVLVAKNEATASKRYLEILELAAKENEQAVDDALRVLLQEPATDESAEQSSHGGRTLDVNAVREQLCVTGQDAPTHEVVVEPARLNEFDSLFLNKESWYDSERNFDAATEGTSLASVS